MRGVLALRSAQSARSGSYECCFSAPARPLGVLMKTGRPSTGQVKARRDLSRLASEFRDGVRSLCSKLCARATPLRGDSFGRRFRGTPDRPFRRERTAASRGRLRANGRLATPTVVRWPTERRRVPVRIQRRGDPRRGRPSGERDDELPGRTCGLRGRLARLHTPTRAHPAAGSQAVEDLRRAVARSLEPWQGPAPGSNVATPLRRGPAIFAREYDRRPSGPARVGNA